MAKKGTPYRKSKKQQAPPVVEESQAKEELNTPAKQDSKLPFLLAFLFGFILYANTIPFNYALDDKIYITSNSFTKQGLDGLGEIWSNDLMTGFFGSKKNLVEGGRYRPLALTTHAIEWELFEENPQISHFINVALYGLTGVVLLAVLVQIFGSKEERWWWSVPFVATLIFLAHPLHTEVTANIKSRDEIMSLLFALLSFLAVLKYMRVPQMKHLLIAGLWFLASLFSKESSVTFLGVIPLTLFFFPKGDLKKSALALSPLVVFTLIYLLVRWNVFADQGGSLEVAKELMNKPYLNATDSERLASIFFTMALYLKLLVWPHPLTHDYYPYHPFRTFSELVAGERPYVDWSSAMAVFGLVAYLVILGYGLYGLYKMWKSKNADIFAYGGLIYFGTFILFSNLFFDIGAFMNERFLYIPSLGFALVLAHVLVERVGKDSKRQLAMGILVVALLGLSAKTIARNYAWENDLSLAQADVGSSDGSAKIKMTMGSEMLSLSRETANPTERMRILKEGERYSLQSLQIYPGYFPPLDILGNLYFEMADYTSSVNYFIRAVQRRPTVDRIRNNLEIVANKAVEEGALQPALQAYQVLLQVMGGPDKARIYSAMGELYGKHMNDLRSSKRFLNLAIKTDPNNAGAYQKIGVVYAMTNQRDSALFAFNRSLEMEPENARVLLNLGILYNQMGRPLEGQRYIQEAAKIDPSVTQGLR
jgi:tetratricopeptide (TPR) repeat protein